jgi:hypothetical protein
MSVEADPTECCGQHDDSIESDSGRARPIVHRPCCTRHVASESS